jgi:hypothetical protein
MWIGLKLGRGAMSECGGEGVTTGWSVKERFVLIQWSYEKKGR